MAVAVVVVVVIVIVVVNMVVVVVGGGCQVDGIKDGDELVGGGLGSLGVWDLVSGIGHILVTDLQCSR